jgi:uncharacterized membrane protein YidH (DUF202 family)
VIANKLIKLSAFVGLLLTIFGLAYQPLFYPDCHGTCFQGIEYLLIGLAVLGMSLAALLWIRGLKFVESKLPNKQKISNFWKSIASLIAICFVWIVYYYLRLA